jgi:rhodanese-related sulfurtransferase
LAFSDEKLEAAFDQRFRDMLNVAVPEKSAPVVFYCVGSQSWHSVNAAMRAVRAGYTNVMWYRGGIQAWQAAGLPTTGKVAVAVIY